MSTACSAQLSRIPGDSPSLELLPGQDPAAIPQKFHGFQEPARTNPCSVVEQPPAHPRESQRPGTALGDDKHCSKGELSNPDPKSPVEFSFGYKLGR